MLHVDVLVWGWLVMCTLTATSDWLWSPSQQHTTILTTTHDRPHNNTRPSSRQHTTVLTTTHDRPHDNTRPSSQQHATILTTTHDRPHDRPHDNTRLSSRPSTRQHTTILTTTHDHPHDNTWPSSWQHMTILTTTRDHPHDNMRPSSQQHTTILTTTHLLAVTSVDSLVYVLYSEFSMACINSSLPPKHCIIQYITEQYHEGDVFLEWQAGSVTFLVAVVFLLANNIE